MVLQAIREELGRLRGKPEEGDQFFFAFIRAAVRNFTAQPLPTRDLVAILGQMTKTDWQPFFDKYVYGVEVPKLR